MSASKREALVAVRHIGWSQAHEAQLAQAIKEHPVILDWIMDQQADTVANQMLLDADFDEPAHHTALLNAYTKGRLSVLLEQATMVDELSRQGGDVD